MDAANAIYDCTSSGPRFGRGHDLSVYGNSSNGGCSGLGTTYANDTGISGNQVLTGAKEFTVKEVEVFEVV
jgi:hypothetical protein